MGEAILEPDKMQKVATAYVCQKESVPEADVKIESFEPSSWNGVPVYLFRGKIIGKQTVDPTTTTWQAGVFEERPFLIWITANEGKIIGYKSGDWRKSGGQRIPQSEVSGDPSDEELKQSEIHRNLAEAEYYEEKMDRNRQEDDKSSDSPVKKYWIDINKFRFRI